MRTILSILLTAGAMLAPPAADAGKLYGLVIGIDDYRHVADLKGAVNDARDVADALTGLGAEVVTLLDGRATRDAVLREWRRLAAGLSPDDQLIVSYAGHGINEPERIAGNEADGRDETLILSGFAPYGAAAGERIVDDEIAELIALAGEGQTIFVADACHSGTLSRNTAPALGFRYVSVGRIEADPLPPPPPRVSAREGREQTALFLGASDDSEKTPEFLIDGAPRGALSYAFAAGLRGGADADGDRILTKGEIETFVRRKVRNISQGSQRPQVAPAGEGDRVLIALPDRAPESAPRANPMSHAFADLPVVTLSHNGGAEGDRLLGGLAGIQPVPAGVAADLRVDLADGTILSMVGDVVRRFDPARPAEIPLSVQAAVDTLRLTDALSELGSDLTVTFAGGDRTYRADDVVVIEVTGRRAPGLTVFNIAPDGSIAALYPQRDLGDPTTLPPNDHLNLPVRVQAPFGADHVIAIETVAAPAQLHILLSTTNARTGAAGFWEAFRSFAQTVPEPPRIAIFPFHTVPG